MTVLNQWLTNISWKTSALRLRKLKDLIQEMKREAEREQKATEREERQWPAPFLIKHT